MMGQNSRSWRFSLGAGITAAGLALSLYAAKAADAPGIFVAYPPDNGKVPASSSFIIGAIAPGAGLSVNGQEARIGRTGFFAHVIGLQPGANHFTLQLLDRASGPQGAGHPAGTAKTITINRDVPPRPVSEAELKILPDSVSPAVDRGVLPGELVEFSVRATPGAKVTMQLDGHVVPFYPSVALKQQVQQRKTAAKRRAGAVRRAGRADTAGSAKPGANKAAVKYTTVAPPSAQATQLSQPSDAVNAGLDAAYGQVYQRLPAARLDRYVGFIKIGPLDQFDQSAPVFTVEKDGRTATAQSPYKVTVVKQPFLVQTTQDDTTVRVGPGAGRITPIARGVRLIADGWHGDEMRVVYAANKHVFIAKRQLSTGQPGWTPPVLGASGPLPTSAVRTINTKKDRYGDALLIPMTQRLPYQVEQSVKPNKLTLKIYGATQDTDWVSPADTDADEIARRSNLEMVEGISFRQVQDGVFEVTAQLKGDRQWGYKVDYEGSTLRLRVKHPPKVGMDGSLAGLKICVDPGHGGSENGSIGCNGVKEKTVNLDISLKLKAALERAGAQVIMTRMTDGETVSLDERVNIAGRADADLLVSVHNNALPDGRDPWKEHGTSTYWYQPQSTELARQLKDSVISAVDFPDIGCRFQNLALCRPTAMPAVLVEVGFMIHPEEFAQLLDPNVQGRVAEGLLKGIRKYLARQ
ncbi:MAG: hypothetical protein C0507_17970 [Cyanobacteria bacterium PR.3.49]|nr:hypothetical protein [Cyanobacteria bacterium PR.3.49]